MAHREPGSDEPTPEHSACGPDEHPPLPKPRYDDDARRKTLSAAKVVVGNACRFISQQSVQLHGGMGMTDELNVSHFFKRLAAVELSFGDTDTHLQRFARLSQRDVLQAA